MNTPPFLSPIGQRFSFMNPRTPRTTSRSPLLSPTRIRPMDDLLADLSPANTFEAFTSNNTSALKKSIEAASPEERAFGIRAAHASQKIQEWVTELSEWKWPEGGSTGFELPFAKRRRLSKGSEGSNEGPTRDLSATPRVEVPEQTEEEYWGSMPVQAVLQYESRIEEITEDMEDLEVEEIKKQVLETHILPRSRPSSSHDAQPAPSIHSYTKMDDFTAVVTATVLQALPNLARLTSLMDVWSVRIVVLRNIQPVLTALDNMEVAMKSAWNAIEKPDGEEKEATDSETLENSHLSRKTFDTIRNVLQTKVGKLGQQLDDLLDTLEGRQDTVPDSWLDRMEGIEEDYSNWTVYGDQKVLEGEWEEQKKRRAAAEPAPVLDDLKSKEEQKQEQDPDHRTDNLEKLGDTVQRRNKMDSAEDQPPKFMKTPPSATTDAPYETVIKTIILNATAPRCIEPQTESTSKAVPAAPFVLKRPPRSIETTFDAQEDQADPPDTPSRNPRDDLLRPTTVRSMTKAKFALSKDEADTELVGLGIQSDSSESQERKFAFVSSSNEPEKSDAIVDSISDTVTRQELTKANTSAVELSSSSDNPEHNMPHEDKGTIENAPKSPTDFDRRRNLEKQAVNKVVEGSDASPAVHSGPKEDVPLSNEHATEIDAVSEKETLEPPKTKSTLHSKHSVESLHSQFDGVKELPTPPELEGAPVDASSPSARLPTTVSSDLRDNNKSEQTEHRKETPPSSIASSITSDMDDCAEDQNTTPARPPPSEIHTPPRPEFGVERATSPRTPSSAGSTISRAIRSPSNQPGTYKKDNYLEDGGTPRSPSKRRLDAKEFAIGYEPASPEKSISQRRAVTTFSTSPATSPKPQSPTSLSSDNQLSDSPVTQLRTLPEVEIEPIKDTTRESRLQDLKSVYVRSPSPETSSHSIFESNPKILEAEPAGHFKPVLSPIKSPRHLGGEYDGATPTKHAPIPLEEFPGFADINARGISPEASSAHESNAPTAFELSDLAAPDTPSPTKYGRLGGLQLSDVDNDSALEDTEEETPDPNVRRASVVSIGKMSRASLKTISRPSSSESGTPITPWKKRFEDSFMTPIHGEDPDLTISPPLSVTSITPSIVTTDVNDSEISPPLKQATIKKIVLANNPQSQTHEVVPSIQKRAELFERTSVNHLATPPHVHTPRHRSVSMATPKSTSMQDSPQTDPGTPPSGFTPKEPPRLKNVTVSHTPPVKSPAKASQDQFHQQITQVLQNIPAQIRLTTEPKNPKSELQVVKKRPSIMSLTDGRRPLTRPSSPAFTLAPAGGRRPRTSNGAPEIKLYHLSRSTGEAPIKLFVRLVGEHGERVMVRVGGGWADLGEYLKEYASHHRRVDREGKVEVQDLSPRSVSNASNYGRSSPLQRPATSMGRASSRLGSRPPSSLERPMSTLAHRRSRLSLGEEGRDSPRTPSAMSMRRYETPPSAGSQSRPSSRASMTNWTDEDSSLGLAGPKSKRIEITEEDEKWIESMKEKVRMASAEKERSFGNIGKAGGTKRLFRKGI